MEQFAKDIQRKLPALESDRGELFASLVCGLLGMGEGERRETFLRDFFMVSERFAGSVT